MMTTRNREWWPACRDADRAEDWSPPEWELTGVQRTEVGVDRTTRLADRACPRAVAEGVLTEPAYFDFISFVQYATITKTMKEPKMIFNELIDANGVLADLARLTCPAPSH